MSQPVPPVEAQPPVRNVMEADPVLGAYVAHHPSNRLLLIGIGAVIYGVVVLLLQILFSGLDRTTAAVVLISAYSITAFVIAWGVLHLWNREVVLYERGFSYREGSRLRPFLYASIVSFQQRAVRINLFQRWPVVVYRCELHTNEDEILIINNIYTQVELLVRRLEAAITRARLPVVTALLQRGETVPFGPVKLSAQALHVGEQSLPWASWSGYRFANNQLLLLDRAGATWAALPVVEIDQILLLVALLKATAEQRQSASRNGTH